MCVYNYIFSQNDYLLCIKVLLDIRHSSTFAYLVNECTPVLAQVLRSFLENGFRSVKLSVSFSDASSWEHWEAPVS